ncbi:hypothetical protein PPYR_14925 [Photinus pyralis]|uniref:AB hydrolase-1 domain-containing protein n=1 Tax=Photinus pyralis TaxID=7054 RepID=A0A5N3ZZY6_PHOPY|nr:probable serine hydrolase [Photinus pyralis]KAB0790635.1 hypothetical protein PPYR_14925 [Photinus pyralis]
MLLRGIRGYSKLKQMWEEIKIPVPWGHIAGKWWGPQDRRPILVLHGWQDNCGSFDRLIPLLKPELGYLAIDFPGHGLSSKLPLGVSYYWSDYIVFLRRVVQYFNWPKVSLLGHSISGTIAYNYATLYPKAVDFLIAIEGLRPLTDLLNITELGVNVDRFIKYDHLLSLDQEGPSYPYNELERRLHADSAKSISLETCKYVLERNIARSTTKPDEFYFTRDLRLKLLPFLEYAGDVTKMTDKFTCPTLLCLGTVVTKKFELLTQTHEFYNVLKKINPKFEIHTVEGTHHVHLNNPEPVAELINPFIERYDVEDWSI